MSGINHTSGLQEDALQADTGPGIEGQTKQKNTDDDNSRETVTSDEHDADKAASQRRPFWRRTLDTLNWVPPNCRWDADEPPKFSMGLNLLFAFAGAFTVANLYYNHPILNILAADFHVKYEKVAQIPTVAQAGYAAGLLFLCPLGDLLKRRPFVLWLMFVSATLTIGLCTTQSIGVFSAIQCIVGFTTVTPQLMMPLVGDLAPPHRRAAALSIVVSGLMLGILLARLLSGIMTNFTSWRNVYWLSVGLQYAITFALWLYMPDYPATNTNLNYFKMLWSILQMLFKHPVLVQACLVSLFNSSTFTNFWTVLTFLLSGPPYHYDPVVIGLFALIGIASMCTGPIYARFVIDRFVPLFSVFLGECWCMLGICLGAYLGSFTVVGPIFQAWFVDFGMQTAQIANRSAIYAVEPKGRNRINTAYMVATFCGQLIGTSVGAHLYARGGWIISQSYSVAAVGVAFLLVFARGPWEEGWVGWHGGWSIRKKSQTSADGKVEEKRNNLQRMNTAEREARDLEASRVGDKRDVEKGVHVQENGAVVSTTDSEKNLELQAADDAKNPSADEVNSSKSGENSSQRPGLKA